MTGDDELQAGDRDHQQAERDRAVAPAAVDPVGYGRPPVHSRFAKGRSGNPKGRPKGSGGIAGSLHKMLGEKITIQQGGGLRRMRKSEAVLAALIARAARGDVAAIRLIHSITREHEDRNQAATEKTKSLEDMLELISADEEKTKEGG